jgi:hypothetical protein
MLGSGLVNRDRGSFVLHVICVCNYLISISACNSKKIIGDFATNRQCGRIVGPAVTFYSFDSSNREEKLERPESRTGIILRGY